MAEQNENLAFARKYRPHTLSEYVGNQTIKDIVFNRFKTGKNLPQVILMYGTRGTGKTSMARLLAREYLCLDKQNGMACGKCEMCLELEEKLINTVAGVTPLGVQELDIAAEGSKANIDTILEEAMLEPMYPAKYKILILDEVHMASNVVQNRLLKVLEDVPSHLVFILCTTNPEKILQTILSRCQLKLEVQRPTIDELADRLLYVCQQERIKTSMPALKLIAKLSDRVPRECMMMLEDVATSSGFEVTIESIQKHTGGVANEVYIQYFEASNRSLESVMQFVQKIKSDNINPKDFLKGITRFVLDAVNIKYAINIDSYPVDYVKAIKKLFKMYNSEELDALLQIIEYANNSASGDNDVKNELIITTTAMRIGKVGLLAEGLSQEYLVANRENKKGTNLHGEIVGQELSAMKRALVQSPDDSVLQTVFGKTTAIVKKAPVFTGAPNLDAGKLVTPEPQDARTLSDDDLLTMFPPTN